MIISRVAAVLVVLTLALASELAALGAHGHVVTVDVAGDHGDRGGVDAAELAQAGNEGVAGRGVDIRRVA